VADSQRGPRLQGQDPTPDFTTKEECLAWKRKNGYGGERLGEQAANLSLEKPAQASVANGTRREWVAIDFETANESYGSACAVGIAIVRDGAIVRHWSQLMAPPGMRFSPRNIQIHGITPDMVRGMPTFGQYWPMLEPVLHGKTMVAHNASFDFGVLRAMFDHYGIERPPLEYFCTVSLARKLWPEFPNHKLNTLAAHLGIPLNHHEAEADAIACAELTVRGCRKLGTNELHILGNKLNVKPRRLAPV